jgi:hypothetical protein
VLPRPSPPVGPLPKAKQRFQHRPKLKIRR